MHPRASAAYGGKGAGCLNTGGSLFVEFNNRSFAKTFGLSLIHILSRLLTALRLSLTLQRLPRPRLRLPSLSSLRATSSSSSNSRSARTTRSCAVIASSSLEMCIRDRPLSLCCGNGHHCKGINEGKGSQHKSQNPVCLSSLHSAKGECRPAYKGNDGTCEYRLLSQVASAIEGVRLGLSLIHIFWRSAAACCDCACLGEQPVHHVVRRGHQRTRLHDYAFHLEAAERHQRKDGRNPVSYTHLHE